MDPSIRPILDELKAGLEELYGDRLDRVILYGSQARGDSGPESDIDVLVVLREPFDRTAEMSRMADLYIDLMMKYGVDIPRHIKWSGEVNPAHVFYRNVLAEGVRL